MAYRPIPFSTPNSSISAKSPFYQADRAKRGKAISKGMIAAAERREAEAGIDDKESRAEDLAEAVTRKR